MRVAVAQLNSNDELLNNYKVVEALCLEAVANKAKLILFPENSLFFRLRNEDLMSYVSVHKDENIKKLQDFSVTHQIAIHLTTAIVDDDKVSNILATNEVVSNDTLSKLGKVSTNIGDLVGGTLDISNQGKLTLDNTQKYNASILIDPVHGLSVVYKKIHLFDIELAGQKAIRESDSFAHGLWPSVWSYEGLLFGSSICYDVRFAELYSKYAKQEVDVIVIPSAFLVPTGRAHWEPLLRARAIESQAYVLAPAQCGLHQSKHHDGARETYGHSMIIDPWGEILSLKESGVGLIYADLNTERVRSVRKQIPMKNHRKL